MLLSQLAVLTQTSSEWSFLGEGSYNCVFLSKRPHTIQGYTGLWVLKQSKYKAQYLSSVDRSVRIWNLLNPKYPALAVANGWLAPYLGKQRAADDEVAEKLIETYRHHRIILADAYVRSNFLKYKDDVVIIDVDYAIRRNSKSMSIVIDDQKNQSKLLEQLSACRNKSPKATSVIHTLLYLDKQALGSAIKDEHIKPQMIELLRFFRIYNKPIVPNTLNYLLTYIKIKPLINIIPEKLFSFVDMYIKIKTKLHEAMHLKDTDIISRFFNELGPIQSFIQIILEDQDEAGLTPIALAAKSGQWNLVIMIATHYHADVEDKKHYSQALLLAVEHNHNKAISALINAMTLECEFAHNTGNSFLHYAIQSSHAQILEILTRANLSNQQIFNAAFFLKNKAGLTPFMLALRSNSIATVGLMNYMKFFDSRKKLQIFLAAGEDLMRAAQSNRLVFRTLLQNTATMNFLDHERLYRDSWLEKERGLSQAIYENRIECLIDKLHDRSDRLGNVNKIRIIQTMQTRFNDYRSTPKSAKNLAFLHNGFAPLLDTLKKQTRQPSGWYLFFCCTQWTEENKKEAEMVFKLAETIGKLKPRPTPALSPLESTLSVPLQSRMPEITFL